MTLYTLYTCTPKSNIAASLAPFFHGSSLGLVLNTVDQWFNMFNCYTVGLGSIPTGCALKLHLDTVR